MVEFAFMTLKEKLFLALSEHTKSVVALGRTIYEDGDTESAMQTSFERGKELAGIVNRISELADLGQAVLDMPWNAKLAHEPLNVDALGAGFKWTLDVPGHGFMEGADPLSLLNFAQMAIKGESVDPPSS